MLFNVWAGFYGFYLLVPGMVCYYVFFLKTVPEAFSKKEVRSVYKNGFLAVACAFIIGHAAVSSLTYRLRSLEISSPRGSIFVFEDYYRFGEFLEYMRGRTLPADSLLVLPEGLTLNFLSERINPLRRYYFLPSDFEHPGFEEAMIGDIERHKVDYVAIVPRGMAEHGASMFGVDYGAGVTGYLDRHYTIERRFAPMPYSIPRPELQLLLLKRR